MFNQAKKYGVPNVAEHPARTSVIHSSGKDELHTNESGKSFSSLPSELRFMIYGYMTPDIPVSAYQSLLLAFKEIYKEALPEIHKVHVNYYEEYAKHRQATSKQTVEISPPRCLGRATVKLPMSLLALTNDEYSHGCPRLEEFAAHSIPLACLPLECLTIRFVSQGPQPDASSTLRGISVLLPHIFTTHLYSKYTQFLPKTLELHWGRFGHEERAPRLWYIILRNIADENEVLCQGLDPEAPVQWIWEECRIGGLLEETRVVGYRWSRL